MGAENSKPAPSAPTPSKTAEPTKKKTTVTRSQYHDIKNPKYANDDLKTMASISSESTTSSEDSEEKRVAKSVYRSVAKKQIGPSAPKNNAMKVLEGLNQKAKTRKSEEMLRQMWKRPHQSWQKITDVTSILTEKTRVDGQICEEVRRRVNFNVDKTIYVIPLDRCHIRVPKVRDTRSCPDPWRKHGVHVKLCEIGGSIPESKTRNAKITPVRRGSAPPPEPRQKPLLTIEDYMKFIKK